MNERMETPCCEEKEETVAQIIRENSENVSRIFSSLCGLNNFVTGKCLERNIENSEPKNMLAEVLWQRSMLERIREELLDINRKMGN